MAISRDDLSDKEYSTFVKLLEKSRDKVEKYQTPTSLFFESENGEFISSTLDYPNIRATRGKFYSKDDLIFQDLFSRKLDVTLEDFNTKEQFDKFIESRKYFTSPLYDVNMSRIYTKNLEKALTNITGGFYKTEVDRIMNKIKNLSTKDKLSLFSANENLQIGYLYTASVEDVDSTLDIINAIVDMQLGNI